MTREATRQDAAPALPADVAAGLAAFTERYEVWKIAEAASESARLVDGTRAWVLLRSGRRLDLLDPRPEDWDDDDLAVGLARTYRWGGHSRWDLPLSVAQNSLTVRALRERRDDLLPRQRLRELLHDAEEGLLGFDPIAPLKPRLGAAFGGALDRLKAAIARRYGLPA